MPEDNQSKWVGIRPTNPPENIPVTESSPLTQIKVEPLAAGTIFKTATEKRAPAIGDMSAVNLMVRKYVSEAKGVSPHIVDLYTVPGDRILMLSMLYATNSTATVTDIDVVNRVNVPPLVNFPLAYWAHTAAWETHTWFGNLPMNEGEIVRFTWTGGAAGGTVVAAIMGYLVAKY